jgi:1,4-alpha-glucan branching enzyme
VCALDTELLGHWWYEGLAWLQAVVEECSRQGLALTRLDDALEGHEPARLGKLGSGPAGPNGREEEWEGISWGAEANLSTWSGPSVAELAFGTRAAELEVVAAGARASGAAVRELLALQASDWAFMIARGLASPYGRERFEGHRRALAGALAAGEDGDARGLRNLAAHADRASLLG